MKFASVLLAVICLQSAAVAVQPGFDPKEVIRQVRNSGREGSSVERLAFDDGEFLIDTSVTSTVPRPCDDCNPAVAFDGANYLVVWDAFPTEDNGIYGARVSPGGNLLDPLGIVVSTTAWENASPAVAFDGTNFLVVWDDWRSGPYDIYGARVTPAGMVLDPSGIPISTAASYQESPALGFDGTSFLVVWEDYRSGDTADIYGARVTSSGTVLDTLGIAISTATGDQSAPAVTYDGTEFLVVWQDGRSGSHTDIYGARVTSDAMVLDTSGIVISARANSPSVASDGTDYLVVWRDWRGDTADIYGARVTPSGIVLDTSGIPIATAAGDQSSPMVEFDGASFFVAWEDFRNGQDGIYATRVTPAGVVLDPSGIFVSFAGYYGLACPAATGDGTNSLLVWAGSRRLAHSGLWSIFGSRVSSGGVVLDTFIRISTGANSQWYPAAAFGGTCFLTVWEDYGSNGSDICGARVTSGGTVLDSQRLAVSQAASDQGLPALAFGGASFLVVWTDYRSGSNDIYGARVTPAGVVLDPNGIAISTAANNQYEPAVAFDGTNFLAVWTDRRSGSDYDLYAARVTPQGTVLDPQGFVISQAADYQESPALAFDGANFLVVWTDGRSGPCDIYGARVTPAGTVLEPQGIAISAAEGDQDRPVIAFDGTNYAVVWEDYRDTSSYYNDIYGARITPDGTVLDPSGICVSSAAGWFQDKWDPTVVFDGASYVVAWDDRRNAWGDIYGARVSQDGTVTDSFSMVRQKGEQSVPVLAHGDGSQTFLVYRSWAGTVGGKTYNTDRIWGKLGPFPGVQETSNGEARKTTSLPTIVRGVLPLPEARDEKRDARGELLDVSGRSVLELHPGANDVSRLAPGVYFAREAQTQAQAVRRVVITK